MNKTFETSIQDNLEKLFSQSDQDIMFMVTGSRGIQTMLKSSDLDIFIIINEDSSLKKEEVLKTISHSGLFNDIPFDKQSFSPLNINAYYYFGELKEFFIKNKVFNYHTNIITLCILILKSRPIWGQYNIEDQLRKLIFDHKVSKTTLMIYTFYRLIKNYFFNKKETKQRVILKTLVDFHYLDEVLIINKSLIFEKWETQQKIYLKNKEMVEQNFSPTVLDVIKALINYV